MFKKTVTLALTLLLVFTLTACKSKNPVSTEEDQEYPVTINGVTIEEQPDSVVVLSHAIAKIICSYGAQSVISGVPDGFEDELVGEDIPRIGSGANPDIDAIIEIAPQILISSRSFSVRDLQTFSDAGIKVVIIEGATNAAGLKQLHWNVGVTVLGLTNGSSKANESFKETYDSFIHITNNMPVPRKTYLYIVTANGLPATHDTLEHSMLSLIATNVIDSSFKEYTVDADVLRSVDPDIVFVSSGVDIDEIKANELFKHMTAIQEGRIKVIDRSLFNNQISDNIIAAINQFAAELYPEVFETDIPLDAGEE